MSSIPFRLLQLLIHEGDTAAKVTASVIALGPLISMATCVVRHIDAVFVMIVAFILGLFSVVIACIFTCVMGLCLDPTTQQQVWFLPLCLVLFYVTYSSVCRSGLARVKTSAAPSFITRRQIVFGAAVGLQGASFLAFGSFGMLWRKDKGEDYWARTFLASLSIATLSIAAPSLLSFCIPRDSRRLVPPREANEATLLDVEEGHETWGLQGVLRSCAAGGVHVVLALATPVMWEMTTEPRGFVLCLLVQLTLLALCVLRLSCVLN